MAVLAGIFVLTGSACPARTFFNSGAGEISDLRLCLSSPSVSANWQIAPETHSALLQVASLRRLESKRVDFSHPLMHKS
jgi:hypothetical protein